jgi:hypothetical protein
MSDSSKGSWQKAVGKEKVKSKKFKGSRVQGFKGKGR